MKCIYILDQLRGRILYLCLFKEKIADHEEEITGHEKRMRSSLVVRAYLTVNAPVATVLGSIPASVGTVESEGRQMKQC